MSWSPSSTDRFGYSGEIYVWCCAGGYDPNRYILNFLRESREEIEKRKKDSQTVPITFVQEHELEVDINEVYQPGSGQLRLYFSSKVIFYLCIYAPTTRVRSKRYDNLA